MRYKTTDIEYDLHYERVRQVFARNSNSLLITVFDNVRQYDVFRRHFRGVSNLTSCGQKRNCCERQLL